VRLVLASTSPRRAELLRAAGFEFDTIAIAVDETIRGGEAPAEYVRRLAAEKSAWALSSLAPHAGRDDVVVLGADTTVVLDGAILGKPRDDDECAAMLRRLSDRRHEVLTGVSLRRGRSEIGRTECTAVYVSRLTEDDVAWYVASGEGRDKAGAYAIQGLASRFIPRIEGSYSNVVGLPVACVWELLHELVG
jgi:septum formation protein